MRPRRPSDWENEQDYLDGCEADREFRATHPDPDERRAIAKAEFAKYRKRRVYPGSEGAALFPGDNERHAVANSGEHHTPLRVPSTEERRTASDAEERRTWNAPSEIRASQLATGEKQIIAMFPYGELSDDIDDFRERVMPGAFRKSILSGRDIRADVDHDFKQLIARTANGSLTVSESAAGVRFVIRLLDDSAIHNHFYLAVQSGLIDGISPSWKRHGTRDRFITENGERIREVLEAELTAIALTAFPAYPGTTKHVMTGDLVGSYRSDSGRRRLLEEAEAKEQAWLEADTGRRRKLLKKAEAEERDEQKRLMDSRRRRLELAEAEDCLW